MNLFRYSICTVEGYGFSGDISAPSSAMAAEYVFHYRPRNFAGREYVVDSVRIRQLRDADGTPRTAPRAAIWPRGYPDTSCPRYFDADYSRLFGVDHPARRMVEQGNGLLTWAATVNFTVEQLEQGVVPIRKVSPDAMKAIIAEFNWDCPTCGGQVTAAYQIGDWYAVHTVSDYRAAWHQVEFYQLAEGGWNYAQETAELPSIQQWVDSWIHRHGKWRSPCA